MEPVAEETTQLLREGIEQHREGKLDRAAELYRQALEAAPADADALHLLGVIAHQRADHAAAIYRIKQAIAINGRSAAYHSNLGVAYRAIKRTAAALAAFRRALELEPTSLGIRFNLGNALKDDLQFSEAAARYREVLEQNSAHVDAWTGLGDALRGLGEFSESRHCHERALELCPRSADAHQALGHTLREEGQFTRAAECFLRAACLCPNSVDTHLNLANAHEDLARFQQAQLCYDRALKLKPDHPPARFNRALATLRQGNLERGWREYESRWQHNGKPRIFSEPEWDGRPDPTSTILVYSEQGIGDEVMFASCFAEVIARCGRCLIECEPRLLPLFARSFPHAAFFPRMGEIDPRTAGVPGWDMQIAAGTLPRVLRPRFDAFPAPSGYLAADPAKIEQWRERFQRLGAGLIVGIAWRGGKDPATRRRRSTSLAQWAPLFRVPGLAFVNLQYGDCTAELQAAREQLGTHIHHWPEIDPLADLDAAASQIGALDLVISVDNATVHLAGALNVPVWTLLPFAADWRWFTDPEKSHWYPSMRLFRQPTPDGPPDQRWGEVFRQVADTLALVARNRAAAEYDRATEFQESASVAEAVDCYRRVAALRPNDAHTLNNLGVAWRDAGRRDLAEAAYRAGLKAEPQSCALWFNLGNTLREENRLDEAVECYERALRPTPADHKVLVNLGVALRDLHRCDEALERLNQVLTDRPDLPEARFDRSLIWLAQGKWAEGWDEYEWRLPGYSGGDQRTGQQAEGTRSLNGQPIRILAEQGIGDQLMFASCLETMARSASDCVVECDARLIPLFARSFPRIQFIGAAPPFCESQSLSDGQSRGDEREIRHFIGSLPGLVQRRADDSPSKVGYLQADPARIAAWRARLNRLGGGFKVGIAWRGGKDHETQRKRTIPLEEWKAVFQAPGVRVFNLQHGPAAADAAIARERFGVPLDDGTDCNPLTDLDDFAAKIAALDLVISADNSTVHLAGALGVPVWTLLPFSADWRWMLDRETTPWYSSMRLLRCHSAGKWADLMQRTARRLISAAFAS
jgi:tetratricopeptide (TPR) repeat protein